MITEILTSIVGGGVTGLLGSTITHYFDYLNTKEKNKFILANHAHEIAMREMDAKIIAEEWNARNAIAVIETEGKIEVADSEAFKASLTSEPKLYHNPSLISKASNSLLVFVDAVRGLVRPGITLYLCIITTAVYLQAGSIIKHQPLTPEQSVDIYVRITETVLYLTTTCVLFWFGIRTREKKKGG